ncbi:MULTISPECIES: tRNA1(Val) (adenine(37)-N6)-methyltransferase [unclassified Bartonella]|uniref:tRNA1(Val) (adenine(37)-N6)-methyltransferase n=1 Tax=unclassified Bartonella TaxID=2645622 RepID=UPI0009995636|nr:MULTISPECIES: methyltransferase [unclassified Bartonella]AQX28296.1 tRNA1(Val) A37 N6-methylase [Bartonella sp. JB15]AQX29567.1 tRNA1(Val) A37 N6-methylase TrmN6 [Bartonella sp. JB63]
MCRINNHSDETIDAFHHGKFYLVQPRLQGHRSGMDAMLLASLVPSVFKGKVIDLGAGAGAAGLAVASRCIEAHITLVERSSFMISYAQKTLTLKQNEKLASRVCLLNADITLKGKERLKAGLMNNAFDFAIMNPPFNSSADRKTPDEEKLEAHVMPELMFENWFRCASAIVKPGGYLGLIARPQSLTDILYALEGRFGNVHIIPIHSHADTAAIRILFYAKRGSRASLSILPALIVHKSGSHVFSPRVDAINNGYISLWDSF